MSSRQTLSASWEFVDIQRDRIMGYMKVPVNYTLVYNANLGCTKRKTTFKSVRNVHEYAPQTCKYDYKENLHP